MCEVKFHLLKHGFTNRARNKIQLIVINSKYYFNLVACYLLIILLHLKIPSAWVKYPLENPLGSTAKSELLKVSFKFQPITEETQN